jgi:hypothetical protein
MNYVLILLSVLCLSCRGCLPGSDMVSAAEFNTTDTATVEIWTRYDLGYEADTIRAVVWYRSGNQWYVRTPKGERWSDREPKILEE